jgi:hypothetical protein
MVWVLQRDEYFTEPRKQGELFLLAKDGRSAICELWSHKLEWELRLTATGETLRTEEFRNQDDVLNAFEQWKSAMQAKGWR